MIVLFAVVPLMILGAGLARWSQRRLQPMTYLPNYPFNARLHLSTMERTLGVPEDRC